MYKHVYFTGFMASGKSRVGRHVAERLKRPFIDTDFLISEQANKTISEIFEQDGEPAFRKMELELIEKLAADPEPKVISLGGGALTQPSVVKAIRQSGVLIRLWAEPDVLSERIGRKNNRPLMAGLDDTHRLEKVKKLLEEREIYYSKADFSVESSNEYPEEHVTERVIRLLLFWESHVLNVETSSGERYPIFIGNNLLSKIGILLEGLQLMPSHHFLICSDNTVAKAQNQTVVQLRNQTAQSLVFKFRAGEINKNFNSLNQLYTFMLRRHFSRKTCLLQFGGGVVGDMAGFGAATYQRGIPFIQLPTTLLSMVDSSVGGKTGVNFNDQKNMIGTFYQPEFASIYPEFLATLSKRELLSGAGEIFKYSFLAHNRNYNLLKNNLLKLFSSQSFAIEKTINAFLVIKSNIVENDEKEITGLRKILNFGHTFAHAFEVESNYKLKHGEAVIGGIYCALFLSEILGYITSDKLNSILNDYKFIRPNKKLATLNMDNIINSMGSDKQNSNGKKRFVLVEDIGKIVVDVVSEKSMILRSIEKMNNLIWNSKTV